MLYIQETLDRRSGDMITTPVGEYITVTELGEKYGVGPNKVRSILYHMGFLHREGRVYRLPWKYVERGYGKRIDKPRSGRPFDVISPLRQALIEEVWSLTMDDHEAEKRDDALVCEARLALAEFECRRLSPMTTKEKVSWLLDHYQDIQHQQIAMVLDVAESLVSRYAGIRADERKFNRDRKQVVSPGWERPMLTRHIDDPLDYLNDPSPYWSFVSEEAFASRVYVFDE